MAHFSCCIFVVVVANPVHTLYHQILLLNEISYSSAKHHAYDHRYGSKTENVTSFVAPENVLICASSLFLYNVTTVYSGLCTTYS